MARVGVLTITDNGKWQSICVGKQTAFYALLRSVCWGAYLFFCEPAKGTFVWQASIDVER
ncbi:hypothetical protein BBM11_17035 [Vibrio parahaemolyticus]|nr:hypothetical protein AKH14_17595 [Vibrio parahaemolyticus]ODX69738.1 hypothetical protein BBM11_17035 [Vibrio parahaemolyticus]ODX80031.1 hypothetical protein BBM10_00655 [Vibrio parahaemolyticus]